MQKDTDRLYKDLYKFFADVSSPEDFEKILNDLCTFNEVEQMAQRLECAKLILAEKTYNQIIAETGVSSATLSRVSRCVTHGSGGYAEVLKGYICKGKKQ